MAGNQEDYGQEYAKDVQNVYKNTVQQVPLFSKAKLYHKNDNKFEAKLFYTQGQSSTLKMLMCVANEQGRVCSGWPTPTNFTNVTRSYDGQFMAMFTEGDKLADYDETRAPRIEFFDNYASAYFLTIAVPPNLHTHFWKGEETARFSPSSEKLLYVAETMKTSDKKFPEMNTNQFNYTEHWGEQFYTYYTGHLFMADLHTGNVCKLQHPCPNATYTHPFWLKHEDGFLCTEYNPEPFRLGLCYCYARPSCVKLAYFDEMEGNEKMCKWQTLSDTETELAAFLPCLNYTSEFTATMYYFSYPKNMPTEAPVGGPCTVKYAELEFGDKMCKVKSRGTCVNLNIKPQENGDFSGVYTFYLSSMCSSSFWNFKTNENPYIFVNTFFGSVNGTVALDLEKTDSGKRCKFTNVLDFLPNYTQNDALTMLDVCNGCALFQHSTPTSPPKLLMAKYNTQEPQTDEKTLYFEVMCVVKVGETNNPFGVSKLGQIHTHLSEKKWDVFNNRHVCLMNPKTNEKKPLVVFLHGGPHTTHGTNFFPELMFLSSLGFDVLAVNYVGSVGFGWDDLYTLNGNAGFLDVKDVYQTVNDFMNAYPDTYNPDKLCVVGGSHGGFLATHLVGQYPDFFSAASTRNPLVNAVYMYSTCDIPDWVNAEILFNRYKYDEWLTEDEMVKAYRHSPIRYLNNVKTPLLFGIGQEDLRVPMTQSLEYHKILKARGKKSRLLLFPKSDHSINVPMCYEHYWVGTAMWFCKFANHKPSTFKN